ncbi:MAG TPA: hypothetical protein VHO90_09680 [Bacteroidales bacterium]|nr:hypothetical protein [Bacteroidales bacterium]
MKKNFLRVSLLGMISLCLSVNSFAQFNVGSLKEKAKKTTQSITKSEESVAPESNNDDSDGDAAEEAAPKTCSQNVYRL